MTFDLQPHLIGRLVALRPLRAEDYDDLYAVAADPLIWAQHPEHNRHEDSVFRTFVERALASRGALVAIDRSNDRIIGSSRYHDHDEANRQVEIGWTFLARSHWGGTYNQEMKHLMLRHAFRFVDRVLFVIGPKNIRSTRAIARIGAVRHGSRLDSIGNESWVYCLDADTFATRWGSEGSR